jgi:REP element-mobilizing transposase RayT
MKSKKSSNPQDGFIINGKKYRSQTLRSKGWDYNGAGTYFITICCKDMSCFFGGVSKGKLVLNDLGKIAEEEWLKTIEIRRDINLRSHNFVIMPNHVHFLFSADKSTKMEDGPAKFVAQKGNMASFLGKFKGAVTRRAREINSKFAWHSNYYDIIVSEQEKFDRINTYISNNPRVWIEDRFYDGRKKNKKR